MIKSFLDWSAVAASAGALIKVLPAIAAVWTIAWLSIRIWESKTVQGWLKRDKKPQGGKVDVAYTPRYVEDDDNREGT